MQRIMQARELTYLTRARPQTLKMAMDDDGGDGKRWALAEDRDLRTILDSIAPS